MQSGTYGDIADPAEETVLSFAQEFIQCHWRGWAARTRETNVYALLCLVPTLVRPGLRKRPKAAELRVLLREHLLLPEERRQPVPDRLQGTATWLWRASRPISDLQDRAVIREALDAICVNTDGSRAAANTVIRRKQVFYHLLQIAVEQDKIDANPLRKLRWTAPRACGAIDPRTVVNPTQARALLSAVKTVGRWRGERMYAAFACMYFAGLRPEEVSGLRAQDCQLPSVGWGVLYATQARPQASRRYTDSGRTFEVRGLKHRAEGEVRPIPIPPELVTILREHIATYGAGNEGHLFRTPNDRPYASSAYSRVWAEVRRQALDPIQAASPLAARPYDLRHAAVSLWLSAGLPVAEVAQRAGHGIDVLLKIYAKCLDSRQQLSNAMIDKVLSDPEGAG